ncbi:MAG: LptF/LptG family permease, partial [Muribaculaceae bacterium]|nr:LptF/LptG family permease [Muribaculaceae bacterium]
MLGIKKLDRFMLRQFLPLFAMTFLICTFIVLMQFLWLHLQDLVGKGVGIGVLSQLFFYAALAMVPMALPLAVLLASLMTFGNLGESLELTALKAGGISLFRVMRPLIVLMVFVSIGAFFFQNNVLPMAQTKMWTLLKSVRQKTPELDIVEGEFNYQLPNINIYVDEKNRETGMLYGVMIYDFREGFERSRVIQADSATLRTAPDKTHMYLDLHHGELFENLREGQGNISTERNRLYRREQFVDKHISVAFDMNLEMIDENEMSRTYAGKNVAQLMFSIDSMGHRLDSIGTSIGTTMANEPIVGITPSSIGPDQFQPEAEAPLILNPDSVRSTLPFNLRRQICQTARNAID